jgi:hypothetical protein
LNINIKLKCLQELLEVSIELVVCIVVFKVKEPQYLFDLWELDDPSRLGQFLEHLDKLNLVRGGDHLGPKLLSVLDVVKHQVERLNVLQIIVLPFNLDLHQRIFYLSHCEFSFRLLPMFVQNEVDFF